MKNSLSPASAITLSAIVKHTLNLSVALALEVETNFSAVFFLLPHQQKKLERLSADPLSTASANCVFCTIKESLKTVCFSNSTNVLSRCMANKEF